MYAYEVLFAGYSHMKGDTEMIANCSCTVIKGPQNIIVDTMTPWDSENILEALADRGLAPHDINYVVSTHGHSDHTGNNNLFLKAKHIVGHSISFRDTYFIHPFDKGAEYVIDERVKIIPTPGHTLTDVTVLVTIENGEQIAIAGDLFERSEDITDPSIWLEAGSEAPDLQRLHRYLVANVAAQIVPGHGQQFTVTDAMRQTLRQQSSQTNK